MIVAQLYLNIPFSPACFPDKIVEARFTNLSGGLCSLRAIHCHKERKNVRFIIYYHLVGQDTRRQYT
jgi:hypothetical protein